jgi:hypothetical protein
MNVIEEVKKLNFPVDQYVIVGSGPMAVRGLKEAHDVDIVVTQELFEKCKANGWKNILWTYPEKIGQIYLKQNDIELYLDVNCADFNPTTKELIERADVIEGVPFINLEDMLRFKRAYNREKDSKDIKITETYLLKNN